MKRADYALEDVDDSVDFSTFCLLKADIAIRCYELKLTKEEMYSVMYHEYLYRTKADIKEMKKFKEMTMKILIGAAIRI